MAKAAATSELRIFESYAIALIIWLAIAPLVVSRYQMISPIGWPLGPPLVLLTTIALFAGFLLLLAALFCPPLTFVLAPLVRPASLSANGSSIVPTKFRIVISTLGQLATGGCGCSTWVYLRS